jgi:hypothetical protein
MCKRVFKKSFLRSDIGKVLELVNNFMRGFLSLVHRELHYFKF